MRNNLQNLAFVCLPVGANTEREDRGIERLGSRSTCNRTADVVVKPQVGHIAREGQTAKVLAGVHGQTPEVGIGRVLGNGAFAVAVAATDRESSTDASAFTEAEVNAEHATVDIGAVAGVAIERIGFVGAVEDISPNTEALLGIQITLDQRVGNQFHRVVGHVVGTGRDRSCQVFLGCTDTVVRQLTVVGYKAGRRSTDSSKNLLVVKVCTFGKYASESALQPSVSRHIIVDGHNKIRAVRRACFYITTNIHEVRLEESVRGFKDVQIIFRVSLLPGRPNNGLGRIHIGKVSLTASIECNFAGSFKDYVTGRECIHIDDGGDIGANSDAICSFRTHGTNNNGTVFTNCNLLINIETVVVYRPFAKLTFVNRCSQSFASGLVCRENVIGSCIFANRHLTIDLRRNHVACVGVQRHSTQNQHTVTRQVNVRFNKTDLQNAVFLDCCGAFARQTLNIQTTFNESFGTCRHFDVLGRVVTNNFKLTRDLQGLHIDIAGRGHRTAKLKVRGLDSIHRRFRIEVEDVRTIALKRQQLAFASTGNRGSFGVAEINATESGLIRNLKGAIFSLTHLISKVETAGIGTGQSFALKIKRSFRQRNLHSRAE